MRMLIAISPHSCVSFCRPLAAVLTGLLLTTGVAIAQDYPVKPVRVVVAFTAGGTTDILARSVGQQLTERLKQPFVIDNRPGGGGNIGTENVVRAPADGYTLLVGSVGPIAINQTLYKNLSYDPLKDLVPVVQIADVPNVLVVHPSVPAKTFEEFLVYLKANPGKLNYGSTGVGTPKPQNPFNYKLIMIIITVRVYSWLSSQVRISLRTSDSSSSYSQCEPLSGIYPLCGALSVPPRSGANLTRRASSQAFSFP